VITMGEYFIKDREVCILDPYKYLDEKWKIPFSTSKELTMQYTLHNEANMIRGVRQSYLDAIGKSIGGN
jgi:hypothetical protein